MPAHTHVNGTRKTAIKDRVVASAVNPLASTSNRDPDGGVCRSIVVAPLSTANECVLPHRRQRATSVTDSRRQVGSSIDTTGSGSPCDNILYGTPYPGAIILKSSRSGTLLSACWPPGKQPT